MIGNGFDLNLKFKTKLADVAEYYISSNNNDKILKSFKFELIKNKNKWWGDFELALGEYTEKFKNETKIDYENQIISFKYLLIEYFEKQELRLNYSKYEKEIPNKLFKYLSTFYEYLHDKEKDYVLKNMRIPNDISIIYNFITFNYTNILSKLIDISKEKYKQGYKGNRPPNFKENCTHYLGEVIHIHHTLREKLILGVDNINQITNINFRDDLDFLSKIVKPLTNSALKENNVDKAKSIINSSQIVCTFGMSLGQTDKTWWDYLTRWLISNEKYHLVIFYYDDKVDRRFTETILNVEKLVRDKYLNLIDPIQDTDRENILNRIHIIVDLKDMFEMGFELEN